MSIKKLNKQKVEVEVKMKTTPKTFEEIPVRAGLIPIWIQDGERGAQAVTNGGVLEVRRSEARRRQRSYTLEVKSVSEGICI
jgi:hypothetical protein